MEIRLSVFRRRSPINVVESLLRLLVDIVAIVDDSGGRRGT